MADYGADPGGYKSDSYGMWTKNKTNWQNYSVTREEALAKRVEELEAEVRKLKGIKKFEIEVSRVAYYVTEASSEAEAREWYEKTGAMTVSNRSSPIIINVKEIG